MDRSIIISGLGHLGLILWVMFGGMFTWHEDKELPTTEVSLISAAEFDAMMAASPSAPESTADSIDPTPAGSPQDERAAEPPPEPEPAPEPAPEPEPAAEPVAEPEPAPPLPLPEPEPDAPTADAVPPAPVVEEAPPVEALTQTIKPRPRPVDRVAPVPTEAPPEDVPESTEVQQATSEEAPPDAPVVQEEQDAAAPEEATTQIVTEATETDEDSPLAPASSLRPKPRPQRRAAAEETPAEAPARETRSQATDDAVAEALAQELAGAAGGGGASDAPIGPPMTAGEKDALRVAVQACWNVGALSTEAMRVTVTVGVQMNQNGTPVADSVRMVSFAGGSDGAARQAYEAARRAILRCGARGFQLPADKYGQWQSIEMTFDPSNMRIR